MSNTHPIDADRKRPNDWPPLDVPAQNYSVVFSNAYLNYRVESVRMAVSLLGPVGPEAPVEEVLGRIDQLAEGIHRRLSGNRVIPIGGTTRRT